VVDFLSVKYFAILNFADIFISVWVFFILLYYFQYERSQRL
jgi:lipoprotein signal peptidase